MGYGAGVTVSAMALSYVGMTGDRMDNGLSYNDNAQLVLGGVLALIVFAIALELTLRDFRRALASPAALAAGLGGQFLVLPALTFALVWWLPVSPEVGLGMLLVSCCPGGSLSNLMTRMSLGDTALSVSLTGIASALAVVVLPLNFALWAGLNPETAERLRDIAIDGRAFMLTLIAILAVPLVLGMLLRAQRPALALRLARPLRRSALAVLLIFIVIGFARDTAAWVGEIHWTFLIVLVHNGLALGAGYAAAAALGVVEAQRRAITLEVGMQNSGLALAIIFSFFGGLLPMALIAAWWGTWHVISGLLLARWWMRRPPH